VGKERTLAGCAFLFLRTMFTAKDAKERRNKTLPLMTLITGIFTDQEDLPLITHHTDFR
jgi:hypothetical protein